MTCAAPASRTSSGIHASPTCVMIYGGAGGATGWLVGEENRGLAAMFVMMNSARLGVGLQGVAIGERALQQALAYARERRQGRSAKGADAASPIIEHSDVRRMLMTMRALTHAARGICHLTALAIDLSSAAPNAEARVAAGQRAALLTPIAKAFSSDVGDEVASLGVQVHGGAGYIEDTGARNICATPASPRSMRANGIQAIDFVQRKLPLSDGAVVAREIAGMRAIVGEVAERGDAAFGGMRRAALQRGRSTRSKAATAFMRAALATIPPRRSSGASAFYDIVRARARRGASLANAGLAAQSGRACRRNPAARTHRSSLAFSRKNRRPPRRTGAIRCLPAAARWSLREQSLGESGSINLRIRSRGRFSALTLTGRRRTRN